MRMSIVKTIIAWSFIFTLILGQMSCLKKTTSSSDDQNKEAVTIPATTTTSSGSGSTSTTTTTSTGGDQPPFSGPCYQRPGIFTGNELLQDYFRYDINALGKGNWPGAETFSSWTSAYPTSVGIAPPFSQGVLETDARFNVRVIAMPHPGLAPGCPFSDPYTKLEISVGLRHPDSAPGQYHSQTTFTDLQLEQCPQSRQLVVPPNIPPGKQLVVDIYNVRWDRCNNGYAPPNSSQSCPMNRVWNQNCFRFLLQFSTDYTPDIPNY